MQRENASKRVQRHVHSSRWGLRWAQLNQSTNATITVGEGCRQASGVNGQNVRMKVLKGDLFSEFNKIGLLNGEAIAEDTQWCEGLISLWVITRSLWYPWGQLCSIRLIHWNQCGHAAPRLCQGMITVATMFPPHNCQNRWKWLENVRLATRRKNRCRVCTSRPTAWDVRRGYPSPSHPQTTASYCSCQQMG